MAEPHVLSALKNRREEIAGELRGLQSALTHLDATIRLFEQGKPPKPRQRQLSRGVLGLLREGPLTAKEMAVRLSAPEKRVMGTLCYQRDRGRVRGEKVPGREIVWEVGLGAAGRPAEQPRGWQQLPPTSPLPR